MEKKEKGKEKKSKKKNKKKKNLEFSRIFANIREIRENARIFGKLFVGGTVWYCRPLKKNNQYYFSY